MDPQNTTTKKRWFLEPPTEEQPQKRQRMEITIKEEDDDSFGGSGLPFPVWKVVSEEQVVCAFELIMCMNHNLFHSFIGKSTKGRLYTKCAVCGAHSRFQKHIGLDVPVTAIRCFDGHSKWTKAFKRLAGQGISLMQTPHSTWVWCARCDRMWPVDHNGFCFIDCYCWDY